MPHTNATPLVAIVDYGMGNLRSVSQAVQRAAHGSDVRVCIAQDAATLERASRIILPGQGAMPDCMAALNASGMSAALLAHIAAGTPLLGVCVGMQMLLPHSQENHNSAAPCPALGLIAGAVRRFQLNGQYQSDGSRFKVPHMGWNRVRQNPHPMWKDIADNAWFYFVHSYFVEVENPAHCAGLSHYGHDFVSVIAHKNIFATQFHPEKSADAGLQLFKNFLHWQPQ